MDYRLPSSPPAHPHLPEPLYFLRWEDGTNRSSVVVPTGRYPLPEVGSDVVLRGRHLVGSGIGGGVLSYPRVSPYCFGLTGMSIQFPCPHLQLTPVTRRVGANFN